MEHLLNEFAQEINKDWTPNYKAEVKGDVLVVSYESYTEDNESNWVECAYVNSNLKVSGKDEDAISQLEYMISR
jgi:hypothetical protein